MARIKIKDLPKDMKISKEEMKNVVGGGEIVVSGVEGGLNPAGSSPGDLPSDSVTAFDQTSDMEQILGQLSASQDEIYKRILSGGKC